MRSVFESRLNDNTPSRHALYETTAEHPALSSLAIRSTAGAGTPRRRGDRAGRLVRRDYRTKANSPIGPIANSDTFALDDAGRMLSAHSSRYNNTVSFLYNDAGRATKESLWDISPNRPQVRCSRVDYIHP